MPSRVNVFRRALVDSIPVAMGYPAGWLVCSLATYLYFRFAHWEKHRIVE